MTAIDGVFSIRLAIADFYMEKPVFGLDPCYSELRGKEIKRVPIIRIFGPNSFGQKTCMHVHGVFPYLYIPYEKRDFESLERGIFQIATHLDKAINISLGQGSSESQHVFKIQLVKGIPFYGYHRNEHQYLKIYMFNPRFVRRAANLLQNGAILNKNFNPHESHVPYILQFMIDYNLYGMSFLHVPAEIVKYRRSSDEESIPYPNVLNAQLLNTLTTKKISCSTLEVDIGSSFILNRFQLLNKVKATHTNPGIEAIWHDERIRREKLAQSYDGDEQKLHALPVLEVPATQERPNIEIAESEIFYRTALISKLLTMEQSISANNTLSEQTINATMQASSGNITLNTTALSAKEQRRTFNLQRMLANAVYPEECTQAEQLVNASYIENHLSTNNLFQKNILTASQSCNKTTKPNTEESVFMDDTIVDEQLVLSLTQTHVPMDASMREEDLQLLDVLQQLEEQNTDENKIDLDSSLAPLSQTHKDFEHLDKELAAAATNQPVSDSDSASENEADSNLHDFSMALDDIDELLLKLTQSQPKTEDASKLPQIDGTNDMLLRTPQKATDKREQSSSPRTPKSISKRSPTRSPRTPKFNTAGRYAPLNIRFYNTSAQKTAEIGNETTPNKSAAEAEQLKLDSAQKLPTFSLRKKLAMTELRRKSMTLEMPIQTPSFDTPGTTKSAAVGSAHKIRTRCSRKSVNLDKTHITCELRPRRQSERLLKVYTPDKNTAENITEKRNDLEEKIPKIAQQVTTTKNTTAANLESKRKLRVLIKRMKMVKDPPTVGMADRVIRKRKSLRLRRTTAEKKPLRSNTILDKNETSLNLIVSQTMESKERTQNDESPIKNVTAIAESANAGSDNDEEEIIASDGESDISVVKLRKTPNLRRLRRSFRESMLAKRIKMSATKTPQTPTTQMPSVETESQPQTPISRPSSSLPVEAMTPNSEDDEQNLMQSFYEHSFVLDSPSVFSDDVPSPKTQLGAISSSQQSLNFLKSASNTPIRHYSLPKLSDSPNSAADGSVIVTPLELPPSYAEVLAGCQKFNIHEHEFVVPHYSNPDDITKMKEVGYMVLQIPGNKLNDCAEFESLLSGDGAVGLAAWRRQQLMAIGGSTIQQRQRKAESVREYFATHEAVNIAPMQNPPSRQDAKIWLKARALMQQKDEGQSQLDIDSPIKIRRQKVTMMLNAADAGAGNSDNEDADCSTRSLTLTPMTDTTLQLKLKTPQTDNCTPLTRATEAANSCKTKSQRKRFTRRAKLSLNAKLQAAQKPKINCIPNEQLLASSDASVSSSQTESAIKCSQNSDNSSISSQVVLAELERESFAQQLASDEQQMHNISFGLAGATLDNTYGFKVDLENLQQAKADVEYNYLTIMTLELFVRTRADLYPDPFHDEIRCLFYAIEHSIPQNEQNSQDKTLELPTKACGYIMVNDQQDVLKEGRIHGIDADIEVQIVRSEAEAFEALLALCARWDPDIFAGYEIEMSSWGYVIERAKYLCLNIAPLLSRVPTQKVHDFVDEERDQYTDLDIEMKICGRILLDVWRLMRSEIALTSYTFENVMYHILHKRCPRHSYGSLTNWFASPCSRWIVIEYYLERVRGTLALLDQLDLIGRTSEMAKLIGIQFYEVLSRGSQFRVESMMLRIAKPKNLVPLSPSVQQRAHMRAPEYLALIMEPESRFYADPVIVLDFQSLYPSMIIAYNYCFSTCLGRVEHLGQSSAFEFGASQLRVSPKMLQKLLERDLVTISPCGVVFVKACVREGILPRMLTEILDTRQMVKQSMKLHKNNSALQRILHSRQLGLKLMANVTYGYTAANFSGRMPAVEVGDTVVSKGRETLERAIKMVETNEKWNVRVVYGDTDSMFVLAAGRDRAQAFKIGEEIAEAVTKLNPHPVKLKLEKVYQPCILQTKKRYVGYMYESPDQAEPVYEAKGIETVRRDGCPAVAKMLEKVLRILFETADVSQVKQYVCRQFTKLLSGRANLQDLIFAKEFRGLNGYRPTACVPALEMTRKWLQVDPRHIPRRGERVPFIIINGPPGVPLIRLVRSPHEVLADEGYKINAIYYITKAIIPPLNRCLLLIGADVNEWFTNLPRKILLTPALSTANTLINQKRTNNANQTKKSTISQYFSSTNCIIDCGRQTKQGICFACAPNTMKCAVVLQTKIAKIERGYYLTQQICQACCGRVGDLQCESLDCPVLYVLEVKRRDLQQIVHFRKLLHENIKN